MRFYNQKTPDKLVINCFNLIMFDIDIKKNMDFISYLARYAATEKKFCVKSTKRN